MMNSKVRKAFDTVYGKGSFRTEKECFLFVWGNASLFHDIGYPIEIASNQAKMFARTIANIGGHHYNTKVGLQIDPVQDVLKLDFSFWKRDESDVSDLLTEGITRTLKKGGDSISGLVHGYLSKMFRDRYVDHGFFSAVILLKSYLYAMQTASSNRESRFFSEVVPAASAILMHNMYPYNMANDPQFGGLCIEDHPVGYLLMMCDILQEWNRKGYGIKNGTVPYPGFSKIKITDDMLRINYVISEGQMPDNFGRGKEEEINTCLNVRGVFAEGLRITCSMEKSADILVNELRIGRRKDVPRPMLESIMEIAKAIHLDYNLNRTKEKPGVPLEYPEWDSLPQDLKYSNMCQALDYPKKLELIGCHIGSDGEPVIIFTVAEIEVMAIQEHDRWVNERVTNGWVYGKSKDVDKRISPYIAPWDDIPEDIKEYDRQAVRNMPTILERVGLRIVRD